MMHFVMLRELKCPNAALSYVVSIVTTDRALHAEQLPMNQNKGDNKMVG